MRVASYGRSVTHSIGTRHWFRKQLRQIPDVFNPIRFHHEKLCCGATPRACGRSRCWRCWRQGVARALSGGRLFVLRMPSSISAHGTLELMNQVRQCGGCCEWSVKVNASNMHSSYSPSMHAHSRHGQCVRRAVDLPFGLHLHAPASTFVQPSAAVTG